MIRIRRIPRPVIGLQRCDFCSAPLLSSPSLKPKAAPPRKLLPPTLSLTSLLSNPSLHKKNLIDRSYPIPASTIDDIINLHSQTTTLKRTIQSLRERRNKASNNSKEAAEEGKSIKLQLKQLESTLSTASTRLSDLSLSLPNTSHPSSPIGSEVNAKVLKTSGPPISSPPPPPDPNRDHLTLSGPDSKLRWTDFESAGLVSGPSWPVLMNGGAVLEMALISYATSIAAKRGFGVVLPPDVVRTEVAERCGFRPRSDEASQTYFLSTQSSPTSTSTSTLCLTGTAEIPLVSLSASTTYSQSSLPIKRVGLGRAFRAEAGARGSESRGLYRVHQFSKVELVVVCGEEDSGRALEEIRGVQEEILGGLGLSLR
ncbi:seryl-tRNA synthetase, partial [Phenoliferia sp. Uapishka_3]